MGRRAARGRRRRQEGDPDDGAIRRARGPDGPAYQAVEAGDTAAVERQVSRRTEALFIGTDPAEWWEGAGPFLAAMRAQAEVIGSQWRLVHEHASFGVPNVAVLRQGVAA
jgi:hypothetical protein